MSRPSHFLFLKSGVRKVEIKLPALMEALKERIENALKVSKFRKQIMVPKLLPKNKPSSLSWKITTSRLIQKRVYLLAKRT